MKTNFNIQIEFDGDLSQEEIEIVMDNIADALLNQYSEVGLVSDSSNISTTAFTITKDTKSISVDLTSIDAPIYIETKHESLTPEMLTDGELEYAKFYRDGFRGVFWSIDDFEHKAQEIEEDKGKTIYDRTRFEYALDQMIHYNDCEWGITWESLKSNLDIYCLLPDEEDE